MSGDVEQVVPEEVAAPVEEAVVEHPAETAEAVERDVEQDTLEIPDSTSPDGKVRYVPASALAGARGELKELKGELAKAREGSAKAQQLEARIDELSAQIAQIAPKAQAYDAALAAQQAHRDPDPTDDAEAIELAQTLDLYTAEGKPDIAKAKRTLALMDKRAGALAEAKVAPLAQHTVQSMSNVMLARAKATKAPNGAAPDPKILDQVWSRLDPRLTATVDGAKQAWNAALGFTMATQEAQPAQRAPNGQFTKKDDIPAPLHTEKAGGRDLPDGGLALNDKERAYIKKAGMTEKEYLESAKNMPGRR